MSCTRLPSAARRMCLAATGAAAAVVLAATPAAAHVEVEAEGARALDKKVTVSFEAESESDSAGITELRVVLPKGIAPADVTYKDGPKGWKLTISKDGYTVGGPAVAAGKNAEYSITVRQLPDAKELAFKTLQTYSDGHIDRWIELPQEGAAESENPAPVLKLAPAKPDATPASPATPSKTASPSPTSQDATASPAQPSPAPAAKGKDDGGWPVGAWIGIGAGVAVLAAMGVYVMRRRTGTGG